MLYTIQTSENGIFTVCTNKKKVFEALELLRDKGNYSGLYINENDDRDIYSNKRLSLTYNNVCKKLKDSWFIHLYDNDGGSITVEAFTPNRFLI